MDGGVGYDRLDAGEGDDRVASADGMADRVACGPGFDRVDADTVDAVDIDCEEIARRLVPPPPDAEASADDRTPPTVQAAASTRQKLRRNGRVRLLATTSERGFLAASGFLNARGISQPLQSNRKRVTVGGSGTSLTVRLTRRQVRRCRAALRRGRRCTVRMWAVGTDLAGNSRRAKAVRIRLRR
jgi:hypothetical protein